MDIAKYIEINAGKRFGKPVVAGTRIAVADVLNWLAIGMTKEDIVKDFPELSLDAINACLLFAATREGRHGIAS